MPERLAAAPAHEPAVARRSLRGLLVLVGALALGLFGALGTPTAAAAFDEGTIHSLANQSRAAGGLGPLTLNASLSQVAANWANQMAANGTMSHNPNYSSQIPGGWSKAAENVAQGYPSGSAVHQGWMNSAGHRANIMGDFTDIGIAHVSSGGTTWSVQVFAKYGASVPAPAPAPPPPQAAAPAPAPVPAADAAQPAPAAPEASDAAAVPQRSAKAPAEVSAFLSETDGEASAADDKRAEKRAERHAERAQGDSAAAASGSIATKLSLGAGLVGALIVAVSGWFRFSHAR
ncbi:CAP domain-containing protein [Homoserinimonas sp. A447]